MSSNLTGQSVGVIRYNGRCTHEINGGGEGKAIFQSPEHAAAWMQQQAALYPREKHAKNVYRCPYFDHYHLTSRPVVMVNGVLVEEGTKASLEAASSKEEAKPAQRQFRKANGDADADAIVSAYRSGVKRKDIETRSGLSYTHICYILRKAGLTEFRKGSDKRAVAPVRDVPTSVEAINEEEARLEALLKKLAEDKQRLIEMTRLHVEWARKGDSISIRKHNDTMTLSVEDCRSLVSHLEALLTTPEADAA